ncbi:MFS transporter [Nocardioides mesophilus]|uniref:MFS transporter n=1 Tax=Nocardioides mesophilus TaxID=433659 RepID=A0A7G9RF10_9ACTN|nr:MFS transporter [Nocardioides mesophilus]QNN54185.1 MFS transporter [Nocardioides mesophilus]
MRATLATRTGPAARGSIGERRLPAGERCFGLGGGGDAGPVTDVRPEDRSAQGPSPDEPDPRRWRILAVTLVIGFMALLDVTIVNVALPSIRQGLGASAGAVQWIISGYALTFGLTLVSGGRLGDTYGRRRMMLIGLTGFVISSAAVGLAPNEELVVAARLVQGVAAGLLTPQNSGLIQELFRGPERGRAFGYFGLTVSVSAATGPVLGGLIISALGDDLGWRAIFLVNVPIGVLALFFIARLVPGPTVSVEEQRASRLDLVGAALLGGAVLSILLPLISGMEAASPVLALLVLAPVFLVAFARWERRLVARGEQPLLDVSLLRRAPGYASGIAVGTLYFTGFTGVFLVLSVYLQDGLGYSALATGLLLTPFALGSALTATPAGRLVSRIGRKVTVLAVSVVIVGLLLVALLTPDQGDRLMWPLLVAPLLLAGLGGGGVVSPNFTLTLAEVPPSMGGAAGGALQTGQRIGSALGAALLMTAYQVTLGHTDDTGTALRVALGSALVLLALTLVLAVRDLRLDSQRDLG